MDAIDRTALLADLGNCQLNHGSKPDGEVVKAPPAVNYVVMPFGTTDGPVQEVKRELTIPVCQECQDALHSDEWTLIYCFECTESHWIWRRYAKHSYRHHILWLRGCHKCGKFGGLYFNEPDKAEVKKWSMAV